MIISTNTQKPLPTNRRSHMQSLISSYFHTIHARAALSLTLFTDCLLYLVVHRHILSRVYISTQTLDLKYVPKWSFVLVTHLCRFSRTPTRPLRTAHKNEIQHYAVDRELKLSKLITVFLVNPLLHSYFEVALCLNFDLVKKNGLVRWKSGTRRSNNPELHKKCSGSMQLLSHKPDIAPHPESMAV